MPVGTGYAGPGAALSNVYVTGDSTSYGTPIDRSVSGFHARVVQHEVDHLHGILYPMRIRDLRNFGFTEVLFPELAGTDD